MRWHMTIIQWIIFLHPPLFLPSPPHHRFWGFSSDIQKATACCERTFGKRPRLRKGHTEEVCQRPPCSVQCVSSKQTRNPRCKPGKLKWQA
ncbi:hypothetical protein BX666DRAFT_1927672 [Dichotomocladium elegans]|nr:hypothetical protein BX666DRAFT_1927672 [Dichotomocladium elegans]